MKPCPVCFAANEDEHKFCRQCGAPLPDAAQPGTPDNATVQWSGRPLPVPRPLQQAASVAELFGVKDRLVIGRAPDCDIVLPHPTVSRYHALVERRAEGLWLRDLASRNGVSVAGRRVREPVLLAEGARVGIGPFLFTVAGGVVQSLDSSRSLRLEARGLEKVVPARGGTRKLLDGIDLVVNPGEFVSLLGPSGSGKSTLMDCLNGRRRATGGRVLANGEDFYRHYASFRQSLGYVPQKDIVHTGLTVARALHYTARLRLPADTDRAELHGRVEDVLRLMELGPHRDTLVANLSGGQVKRVSLGAELLAQPCLLYIDEATSGLDAGTEARMMRLFRRLADEGRSIVCITHNVDNVDQCHLALVLCRGRLVFYGPPAEAPAYFGVGRVSEIYDRLADKDPAAWEKEFAACSLHRAFVADRLAAHAEPPPAPPAAEKAGPPGLKGLLADGRRLVSPAAWPPLADRLRAFTSRRLRARELLAPLRDGWHQFRVLTARTLELTTADRRGLALLLLQAPIVAAFLLVGFAAKDYRRAVPFPRPLEPGERRMLEAVRGLEALVANGRPLDADQQRELGKVRFEAEVGGRPVRMDGTEAVRFLRSLRAQSIDPAKEETLKDVRLAVDVGGRKIEVNGADAAEALKLLQGGQLPARLLAFDGPVLPDRTGIDPRYTYMLLFILVVIVLWFGCNNAAKEIVKEEAIYARERAVNLGIAPYLASKFFVFAALTALHALLLMGVVYGTLALLHLTVPGQTLPHPDHMLAYLPQFGVFALLATTGVALGLLLSACVATPDRANALLPYVLIPQLILGGGFLAVHQGMLFVLAATLSPVYWAYRAVHRGAQELPAYFPGHVDYPDGLTVPCLALAAQTLVLLALTAWLLRRKEA
jgi:ABC-type multidrug transport system ATPase subunit